MPDDLYTRYMTAAAADRAHREACTACSPNTRCPAGQPLYEQFSRLQDAYLQRQRDQQPRSR